MIDSNVFDQVFKRVESEGRAAFIPYITAGDPNLEATGAFIKTLVASGADIIEIGVPFSDPMADGPVNQRAAYRALRAGVTLKRVLDFVKNLRADGVTIPLVLFAYFNPVFRMGVREFAARARESGVDGVLLVDMPIDEAQDEYVSLMKEAGLRTVFLASPTSGDERLRRIGELSSAFVYYVSRTGVTGTQAQLSNSLADELQRVRAMIDKPIAVGFGISNPDQASKVSSLADGVVIGSAITGLIEECAGSDKATDRLAEFATGIVKRLGR